MSRIDERMDQRQKRTLATNRAAIALVAAGSELLRARGSGDEQADALITAMREDIQRMIDDLKALREMVRR